MSRLDSLLGYSTGEFQALQMIGLAVFGAVDWPLASSMLVHLLKIKFEMIVSLQIWHNGEQRFSLFLNMFYIYRYASHYEKTFSFILFSCLK